MILIIVESPAKCKKIESYLGNSYKCLASYGHIREFANGLKSIDYNNHYKSLTLQDLIISDFGWISE